MKPSPHFLFADLFSRYKRSPLDEILSQNVLFSTLTRKELRALRSRVYERTYQIDEAVFEQGDRGFGMYIIAKGRVAIQTHAVEGDLQVTTLGAGSFFGELALIDPDNLRSARAIATEPTVLIGFFKADLMDLLERQPGMGVKVLYQLAAVLGQRLLESTEKINLLWGAKQGSTYYGEVA